MAPWTGEADVEIEAFEPVAAGMALLGVQREAGGTTPFSRQ